MCNNSEIYNDLFISQYGDENMSCPMYKDFTRECITEFKDVITIANYAICESDKYEEDCPFYKFIKKVEPRCDFVDKCPMYFHVAQGNFQGLINMTKKYCYSEKYTNCARYELKKAGKDVSKGLYPDGNMIELKT